MLGAFADEDFSDTDSPSNCAPTELLDSALYSVFLQRVSVLLTLMYVQSLSSNILQRYQATIERHVEITLFLTMVVGAGGNASNQVAVSVIRGLATGALSERGSKNVSPALVCKYIWREAALAFFMAASLGLAGYFRVSLTLGTAHHEAKQVMKAVGAAVFCIIVMACGIGTILPLLLRWIGSDPAHAGPAVQVIMDILGVQTMCYLALWLL